ncbi:MAG: glycosyltransferase [Lachnospiraceae bacterium]|nr:glycosyltransferase [Lachnospiraceae bacterium]
MNNSKEKNFVSAVIYVRNAEKRIDEILRTIMEVLEDNFEHSEIICVNDSSSDNSVAVIKEISKEAKTTCISVLNMSYFHGLETAMKAGVDLSIGDFVYEFDNTYLDYDKEEIIRIYKRALEGYDIVSASSNMKQRGTSRLFYYVFNRFTELNSNIRTESFRILSRRVINRISSMNKSVPYRKVIYANCGLKTDNLAYEPTKSKLDKNGKREKKYRSKLAADSLILFTDLGYGFTKAMTVIMILATIIIALYSLAVFAMGNPVEGWTTMVLFFSFCFFGLFGILTFIIKYLQIIVDLVFKRKQYSFESIEKLTK